MKKTNDTPRYSYHYSSGGDQLAMLFGAVIIGWVLLVIFTY